MKILLLAHAFNSLTQRLHAELRAMGHEVSVELDINDAVTIEACELFAPDLVIAPFLKRAIPDAVWSRYICLVVHPGIAGDRGPSALDWAIHRGEVEWGVTIIQANAQLDGGDIWAERRFPMRAASKSSLYRNEVTEAAVAAIEDCLARFVTGDIHPLPQDQLPPERRGTTQPAMRQSVRAIDWLREDTATILAKLRAAEGMPGVLDELAGRKVYLHDPFPEAGMRGPPGSLIARREGAVLRATRDGAVWLGQLRLAPPAEPGFKLPATTALGESAANLPELALPALPAFDGTTWQDIAYEESDGVAYLHFAFANGAMSARDCRRLRAAFLALIERGRRVIVLTGGQDFWSNGIHLKLIECADSPADESWDNIQAMNDLCLAILTAPAYVVAALRGNAGAGGVFLALAADAVWARRGVVLNPHYRNMGNLYGSEYWTYVLPRRVGAQVAREIMDGRLPIAAPQARQLGIVDECFGEDVLRFDGELRIRAARLVASVELAGRVADKRERIARDQQVKPLACYREEELAHLRRNFYGFDPSYHVARFHFVHRVPHAWTPLHLATHRRLGP